MGYLPPLTSHHVPESWEQVLLGLTHSLRPLPSYDDSLAVFSLRQSRKHTVWAFGVLSSGPRVARIMGPSGALIMIFVLLK